MVRTHKYTDISHFRAPYKNWPSLGADTGAAPSSSGLIVDDGVVYVDPKALEAYLQELGKYSVIFLDNESVQLAPVQQGDPRENAVAWGNRKLGEGKSIVLQSQFGPAAFFAPPQGATFFLRAGTGKAFEKEAAGVLPAQPGGLQSVGAVLTRPGGLAKAGMLGSVGIVVAVLAVGGLAYLAFSKPKRRAA